MVYFRVKNLTRDNGWNNLVLWSRQNPSKFTFKIFDYKVEDRIYCNNTAEFVRDYNTHKIWSKLKG